MPNLVPVTVTDGATPLVFSPIKTRADNTIAETVARNASVPMSSVSCTLQSKRQTNNAHRTVLRMTFPVIAEVGGIDTIVDNDIVEVNIRSSELSTPERIQSQISYLRDYVAKDFFLAVSKDREGFW